jgi:hypothetical protein
MEHLRLREFQPGICRYAKKQKPDEEAPAPASPETAPAP